MLDPGRELLLLGMVRRKPLSAYDIDRAIRSHSPLYRPLGLGNVYHLVERLTDKGYLLRREIPAARGPSETKRQLRISAQGEAHFLALLHKIILDPQAPDSSLEVAFVLLGQLPRSEAIALLEQRRDVLASYERRVRRLFGDPKSRSGPGELARTHALGRLASEQACVRDLLRLLRRREWHSEWAD